MKNDVTIFLERYSKLMQQVQKARQYRNYFLENTQNSQLSKTLCTIECKNLFQIIKEEKESE